MGRKSTRVNKNNIPKVDPSVPTETLLRKRKNNDSHRKKLAQKEKEQRQAAELAEKKKQRAAQFKRAEVYVKNYRSTEREHERIERAIQDASKIEIPKEPKLLFVVRIKADGKIVPRARKILQAMRIFEINNGVFVRLNENTAELLRIIEPFVAFGYPSLNSVRTLVYKRAFVHNKEGEKVSLTDNTLIEDALGEEGIICMEDLIHEIYTLGPNFKKAANFLYPFQLSSPTGGWGVRSKFKKFIEGEGLGERAHDINALIEAQN